MARSAVKLGPQGLRIGGHGGLDLGAFFAIQRVIGQKRQQGLDIIAIQGHAGTLRPIRPSRQRINSFFAWNTRVLMVPSGTPATSAISA